MIASSFADDLEGSHSPISTRFRISSSSRALDNNAAERSLRGPVLGRKNHYGSRSKRGIHVAEILFSLCETAKLNSIDPRAYLIAATKAAIRKPEATMPEDLLKTAVH